MMQKTMTVWMVFLAAAACGAALAADEVRIEVGETGLRSLTYKGVEYADPAGAGALGFTGAGAAPRAAKKEDAAVFATTPTSAKADGTTVTQTYPWGTFVVTYEAKGADLTVTATLRNTSGKGLEGWRANVLQLNDRLVFRPGGDPHGNGIHMQWCHYFELNAGARDGYAHLTQQYPHVYWWVDMAPPFDKQSVKVMFADLTGTWDTGVNRVKTDSGDRWPVFAAATAWEMAPPGQVQQSTIKVAIRFRDQDAALRLLVDRLYQQAQAASGAEKTAQETLAHARQPPRLDDARPVDPEREQLQAALETEARPADAAERALKQAQAELGKAHAELAKAKLGALPKEQIYDNGGKEMLPKAKYARDRWGCTLFYVDSISGVFGYWAMDEAARALPDCLFLPEWATARSFRCSAQLSVTGITGYRQGVPLEIQAAWPDAFCAMFHLDYGGIAAGKNEAARADLVTAVKRGNLPVFDCFYNNSDAIKVISDVYAETGVKHTPAAKDQLVSATPDQPVSITLTATDEDGDTLTFAILGPPAHGALSAFDAKTGTVTYTPTPGWQGTDRFTFKAVDSTGLNSNRGKVMIDLKPTKQEGSK